MQLHSIRHREPASRWEEKASEYIDAYVNQLNDRPEDLKDKYPGYLCRLLCLLCNEGDNQLIAEWDDTTLRLHTSHEAAELFYTIAFIF